MNAIRLMAASAIWFVPDAPVLGQIPCSYEISHIIQAPPCPWTGPPATTGTGISPDGHYVCGFYAQCEGYTESFVYDTTTAEFFTLPRPKGVISSTAADVNDNGQVVGQYEDTVQGKYLGYIYDLNSGEYTELEPQPGGAWAAATAINSSSTVCGWRSIGPGVNPYNAFIWSPKDGFKDLGVVNGPFSSANDLNDSGLACGYTGSLLNSLAVMWTNETTRVLGPIPGGSTSYAAATNAIGDVAGTGKMLPGGSVKSQPFLWSEGSFTLLGLLPDCDSGGVRGMNSLRQITGSCGTLSKPNDLRAYVWQPSMMRDLNTLIPADSNVFLERGKAIDELGHILVDSSEKGSVFAVLLTPVDSNPGDCNCDSFVNVDDLLNVINNWGPCLGCAADFTDDGSVNVDDLITVLNNWTF